MSCRYRRDNYNISCILMKAGEGWSYRKVTWDGMENKQ